jgi:hypothetical protein
MRGGETMAKCKAKHTNPQIPDEEFYCPNCGKYPDDGGLCIDDPDPDSLDDCPLLHTNDVLRCYHCDYECMGDDLADLARRYKRKNKLVTCPCCNGKGVVTSKIAGMYKRKG